MTDITAYEPTKDTPAPVQKKRKLDEATSSAIVPFDPKQKGPATEIDDENLLNTELVLNVQRRTTVEINPHLIRKLEDSNEIGYRKPLTKKKAKFTTLDVDPAEVRRCIAAVLQPVLLKRYLALGSYRSSEIAVLVKELTDLTVDACMAALYAKFRSIHRTYGTLGNRYTTPATYTREMELPLPLALAIEEFGAFETHSLTENLLLAPTYPEGTKNEGRSVDELKTTEYISYLPTFKELRIPCKAVDTRLKNGTAWWTLKVRNTYSVTDLQMTLPPSHYSDLAAQLRALFLAGQAEKRDEPLDFVKFTEPVANYGIRYRDLRDGYNIRVFFALIHGPEEEWSHYA